MADVDLRKLRYFVAVAEKLDFGRITSIMKTPFSKVAFRPAASRSPAARTPAPPRRVPATAPQIPPAVRRPRKTRTPAKHTYFANP
jgi:hypothetical protein